MYSELDLKKYDYFEGSEINYVLDSLTGVISRQYILDYAKRVIYEAAKTADDLDTKDREDLAEICKANGVEVPFNEFEPDVPQRGSNPNDHYSY